MEDGRDRASIGVLTEEICGMIAAQPSSNNYLYMNNNILIQSRRGIEPRAFGEGSA
jgi:hypothetical protein